MQYIFIILFSLLTFNAFANDMPIEVTADKALEWDRANMVFTAKGNALISQGGSSINAATIKANYNESDDGINIQSVLAEPNATLKQPTETLTANKINADFKDGVLSTITASGNVVLKTDKETLRGNKATYNAIKRTIIVTGNVRIEQGDNILTGSRAEFNLNTNISKLSNSGASNGGRVRAVFGGK